MFNDFDIRQSFPPISLMDKKDKTISEVFEGSSRENVIVRELWVSDRWHLLWLRYRNHSFVDGKGVVVLDIAGHAFQAFAKVVVG